MTRALRITSRSPGAFSQREMVGCEHRSTPLSGRRPQASLSAGSVRRLSRSSASSYPHAMAKIRARKLLSDAQPTLGGGAEHHPAIGADASAVKGGNDLLAGHGWKGKGQQRIV